MVGSYGSTPHLLPRIAAREMAITLGKNQVTKQTYSIRPSPSDTGVRAGG